MNNIQILDCTLRDGGYVNNWDFGEKVIKKILKRVSDAHIDIVECGFLSETEYDVNRTIFNETSQIEDLLPEGSKSRYVAMVALGEKEISYEKIGYCDGKSIFGIRLTFHKHEVERAFEYATNLMEKGYQVFMQPVGTCTYSDKEILELVEKVNLLHPYAFYIVDTLGTITGAELMRLFQLIDNNLDAGIRVGFHSHNNLQLAFANSQELIRVFSDREIILDASVLGMGRGAGNLCTELIAQYMNEIIKTDYNVTALLEIVDNYLMPIKAKYSWGYSIPYYIAAVHKCHPNYAIYLMNRQTLNVKDIERIILNIPKEKCALFDKECISQLYNDYQSCFVDDSRTVQKLQKKWKGKKILLLAPGKTLIEEKDIIREYIEKNEPYVININFISDQYKTDMVFISNLKRFEDFDSLKRETWNKEIVITSNISTEEQKNTFIVNYIDYLNLENSISDNAGLMLCKLLKKCDVRKISLAGFDGFTEDVSQNYFDKELINNVEASALAQKTEKIREQLRQLKAELELEFITTSQYNKE